MRIIILFALVALAYSVPVPNKRQLEWMELEISQFMHYSVPTYWNGPHDETYHNCKTTKVDHSNQTGSFYPCLDPILFDPPELDCEQWVQASMAMGVKEMCLTAKHEGGFTLWPSEHTPYGVKMAKNFKGGNGDVLREFADACNKHGMKICYYLNIANDGYLADYLKVGADEFATRTLGMLQEVVTKYGPVNRFWFDGTHDYPRGTGPNAFPEAWAKAYEIIRTNSPDTLISPYRGDICDFRKGDGSLYMRDGPKPNSTWDVNTSKDDTLMCQAVSETGKYFIPSEAHGITFQQGLTGNGNGSPTFWFYHPWIGHANASRLYKDWKNVVGHGKGIIINIPPARSGQMDPAYVKVMAEFGQAIKDSYTNPIASLPPVSQKCGAPIEMTVPTGSVFDLVVTGEDLTHGQRVANYSIEFQRKGSARWEVLVPPVLSNKNLRDTPNGDEPRDSRIGRKRIDVPIVDVSKIEVEKIRFVCISAFEEPIFIKQFAVFKEKLPWST